MAETSDVMAEISDGTPLEKSHWRCPKCWATQEKGLRPPADAVPAGTVICNACGAALPESDVYGGKYDAEAPVAGPASAGKRNPFALLAVAVVASAMLYFGFHMARRSGPTPRITKSAPAPDFTLQSLEGKSMRLSDLRGKAVLLNFWATWCSPCKIEMPWFIELQNQYGAQGLQIVGVAMDESSKEDIAKFAKDMGVNYPVLLGKEEVGEAYGGVPALPESFFIGRDGKIVDKIIGLKGKADIEDSIKKALGTETGNSQASFEPQN
jgi:cytochrome c biogenesis protein CcmG/thiol:disulfide interchange protein DsbE